jgi:glucokinase
LNPKSKIQNPKSPAYAIGIDLGGSSIKAVAVTRAGKVLACRQVEFASDRLLDWASRIRRLVAEIQTQRGAKAARIGLSAPGLAARDRRSVAFMPGRLQGLEGLDWTKFLSTRQRIPVLNDAHAALLGEAWLGAAAGFTNVVMLTLGTGVGGAAIVDGRLLRGHLGRAGHLGHICLDPDGAPDITRIPGSLELMIGNCTIRERSGGRFTSTHDLIAAHQRGDSRATDIWLQSVKALACAVASFINILDPQAVILGGGIACAGKALFKPLERELRKIEWQPGAARVRVMAAKLGEYAGAMGAGGEAWGRCE